MEISTLVKRAKTASQKYAQFTQKQVDEIFKNAALAASMARIPPGQDGRRRDQDRAHGRSVYRGESSVSFGQGLEEDFGISVVSNTKHKKRHT